MQGRTTRPHLTTIALLPSLTSPLPSDPSSTLLTSNHSQNLGQGEARAEQIHELS